MKNRGVNDILIACIDGLSGFTNAIEAVFPQTEIQQCIIHQIRNYVSYKDIKALMADLKRVYAAVDEDTALQYGEENTRNLLITGALNGFIYPHILSILKQCVHLSTQLIR